MEVLLSKTQLFNLLLQQYLCTTKTSLKCRLCLAIYCKLLSHIACFYAPQRGNHIVAVLSVCLSIRSSARYLVRRITLKLMLVF